MSAAFPITLDDVRAAATRIGPHLAPTPLRHYPALDEEVGAGIRVLVKHDNHLPTNAFKARNGLSVLTAMDPAARARGVVAATRGNHGQGLAWAAQLFGVPAIVCVPHGNNPEKNRAMRGFGAELIEAGADYDEAVRAAEAIVAERGATMVHSTNDPHIIAGAGTITLEIAEQAAAARERLDAMVVAVGGGSQAVGALTVMRALHPDVPVYAVQAARASAIHDSWHAGEPRSTATADTIADGLATRHCYEGTFGALRAGLAGFVTVSEGELAEAVRMFLRTTHNLAEPAGAAGLAGLRTLRDQLAGKTVAVILSGSNIDQETLTRVLTGALD